MIIKNLKYGNNKQSYARRNDKEEINVKCANGHSFCLYCLKAPHENGKCERRRKT